MLHLHILLLSVSQFCDSDCTIIFQSDKACVLSNNEYLDQHLSKILLYTKLVLSANWNKGNDLYTIDNYTAPITSSSTPPLYNIPSFYLSIIYSLSWYYIYTLYIKNKNHKDINNLYQLWSFYDKLRYLYTALGCPVKSMFLAPICNGNFTS